MSFLGAQNSIALGVQGIIAIDTGTGTIAVVTDPYWPFVSTLLHGDGTNAAQNNTFLDTSTNNFTVTRNGNTTQGSFNPFVKTYPYAVATNGGSAYFDGTGDYLTVPDNAAFTLGANDFTIECWVNFSSLASQPIFAGQSNSAGTQYSFYMVVLSTGEVSSVIRDTSGIARAVNSSAGAIIINTWNHVAFVRNGNTIRQYINGVQAGTLSVTGITVYDSADVLGIGSFGAYTAGQLVTGYISNFRLVNGTCLYPSGTTFTPPTAPLTAVTNTALLLGFTNGAIYDNAELNNLETVANAQISTSVFKYGTGALKFNGTTDYLPTPAKTAFVLGSADFTVEMWIYPTGSDKYIVGQTGTARSAASTSIYFYSNFQDTIELNCGVGGILVTAGSFPTTAPLNAWTHIAGVRDGATIRVYINGVQAGTASISTSAINTSTNNFSIGRAGEYATTPFPGYIDDFRFTKGICRYPSGTTFTPPTAAFPNLGPTYPSGTATQRAIFGFGQTSASALISTTNIVSNTGVVAGDTTGVGTTRGYLAASSYGGDKAIFGFGFPGGGNVATTNLVSNTGVVASDTAGVGTARASPAAARYSTDKAIFGFGAAGATYYSITNLVSNVGVVATDTTGVGTTRRYLAATSYGADKAIFGYGFDSTSTDVSMTNLVSNTGVVASNTTGVGTPRYGLAAAGYGSTGQAIFGYGVDASSVLSVTNLVSNTGVVATNTTGVGTARGSTLAAAGYGGDKAIFGFGATGSSPFYTAITNLVSNTGVVSADQAALTGTIRAYTAAAGFSYS